MNPFRYVILVDMDGPLADFDAKFFRRCEAEGWALNATLETRTARFATEHIVDRRHRAEARRVVNSEPGWFRDLPPVRGMKTGMETLASVFDEVWICTKPLETNPTCRDDKGAWVEEHLGSRWVDRLIIAPDKSLVRGAVLLDDAPRLEWLPRAEWAPVLFDTPFNRPGSEWGHLPRWDWSRCTSELLLHALEGGSRSEARRVMLQRGVDADR